MAKRTSILCVFIIAIMIALSGCVTENTTTGNQNDDITTVPDIKEPTSELKKFSSAEEINEFLKKSSTESSFGQHKMTGIIDDSLKESTGMISAPVGGVASDYSTTNIQVKDVDEPDFVKNDNKYIYLISENKLVIVDAYPAENANIISQTEVNGTPQNIFINKDRLVVFTQHYDYENIIAKYDYIPRSTYTQKTHALIYDISNKENPELIKDYNLQGNYYEARMIDNYVYFIVKESTYNSYYYDYGNIVVPIVRESSDTLLTSEVYYFDNPEYNYNFNTIVSFDIFGKENSLNAKTYMLGYSNNLYVSKNNIYITYQKNMPWNYYTYAKKEIFFEVIVPILPTDAAEDI
ncbi:MAG: beta-propeller domain-containing protein, partial [Candidatus Aenigmarchaeota archaeon]|nr:beta-propeller domain-containing protein [Candidatus Aenigmarchaeota archaeon]